MVKIGQELNNQKELKNNEKLLKWGKNTFYDGGPPQKYAKNCKSPPFMDFWHISEEGRAPPPTPPDYMQSFAHSRRGEGDVGP